MNSHLIVGGLRRLLFPLKSKSITNFQYVPRTDTGVPKVRSLRRVEIQIVREIGKMERNLRKNACLGSLLNARDPKLQ
jgi:hypothetical protein